MDTLDVLLQVFIFLDTFVLHPGQSHLKVKVLYFEELGNLGLVVTKLHHQFV